MQLSCIAVSARGSDQNQSAAEKTDSPASNPENPKSPSPFAHKEFIGVKPPRIVHNVDPFCSDDGHELDTVVLELIVSEDGKPKDIKVVRSVSQERDKKSFEAVSQWRFAPATKDGKPVAVRMSVEVHCRARKILH